MPISFDAASEENSGGIQVASLSWSHVCAGDDLFLIVGFTIYGVTVSASAVTYNGVPLTKLARVTKSTYVGVEFWYLDDPDTGSHTVAITLDGSEYIAGGAVSYNGVREIGNYVTATGTSNPAQNNISSRINELVVDVFGHYNTKTETPGDGQTERFDDNSGAYAAVVSSEKTGATTVQMSWTLGAGRYWGHIILALRPFAIVNNPAIMVGTSF